MDESAKQLLQDKREPLPVQKGLPERVDYTFESAGMRKLFLACVLVMDNLNTHTPSSSYSAFAPPEALRVLKKLEIHYKPVHGSWLNMAEIELSALARQCLSRRIGTQEELEREVLAWQAYRNEEETAVNWRFTTADARIKLKRLYPSLETLKRLSKKNHVAKKD